jgi:O-antigen ligase
VSGASSAAASLPPVARSRERSRTARFVGLALLLGAATVGFAILGNGRLEAAIAPTLLFVLLWVIWKVPLRYTLFALIFLGLTLESPYENPACNLWHSPLWPLGQLLLQKWNDVFGPRWLAFFGADPLVLFLVLVLVWRRSTGSVIDRREQVPTAPVMALAALVTLAGTLWIWGYGLARGGDFTMSLLQIHKLLYVPLLFFICQAAFRGPADHLALAKVMVAASIYRALLAFYVLTTVAPPPNVRMLPYATTHGDSMLFAGTAGLLIAMFNEKVGARRRGARLLLFLCLALDCVGVWANHRRVAWVEIGLIAAAFYLISPWTALKRAVTRAVLVGSPIIGLYLAVGWNSAGGIFKPVATFRSVIDSKSDGSTLWRDLENMNLVNNIIEHPLLGTGFGHEYREDIKLPDVSQAFKMYRLVPHNSILGFLAYAGLLGFSMLWCAVSVATFLAARAYRKATQPLDRAMALWTIGVFIAYLNSIYGDMGHGSWTAVFTVCPAMAVAGKLAVATGAWPAGATSDRSAHRGAAGESPPTGPEYARPTA